MRRYFPSALRTVLAWISMLCSGCALAAQQTAVVGSDDGAIYSAVLEELYVHGDADLLIVAGCTRPWGNYGVAGEGLGWFQNLLSDLPPELVQAFLVRPSRRLDGHELELSVPVELLPLPRDGECPSLESVPDTFREHFPAAPGFLMLSPVGYTAERDQALVHVWYWCGPRCGGGQLISLVKQNDCWQIRQAERTMIH